MAGSRLKEDASHGNEISWLNSLSADKDKNREWFNTNYKDVSGILHFPTAPVNGGFPLNGHVNYKLNFCISVASNGDAADAGDLLCSTSSVASFGRRAV